MREAFLVDKLFTANNLRTNQTRLLPFYEVRDRLLTVERDNSFARVRFLTNEMHRKYADIFPEGTREGLAKNLWKLNYPRAND